MLALKACIAPKARRRGRTGGKGAVDIATGKADGAARGKARSQPAASSPVRSAQAQEAACALREAWEVQIWRERCSV